MSFNKAFSVAINTCNLHNGGGVQVATSFIDELSFIDIYDMDIHIFVSKEIDENLEKISSPIRRKENYKVINVYGFSACCSNLNEQLVDFDLVFTVFGPSYLRYSQSIKVVGFAQPWIIDKSAYHLFSKFVRIKTRFKYFIQSLFFKRADVVIVELEHVAKGLIKEGVVKENNIKVVYNCISSLYGKPDAWEPLSSFIDKRNFSVGFVGRDYPHKNTNFLSDVKRILAVEYSMTVDFYVTLNDDEWGGKSKVFKEVILNVGSLSVTQCPSFYQQMDAVIFPSLLECFSATPLEAMAMEKPLFASDRGFVRDVCGDFAFYFDPLDAKSAAKVIAKYIKIYHGQDQQRLAAAREHAFNFSNARQRAESYLNIIREALAKNNS